MLRHERELEEHLTSINQMLSTGEGVSADRAGTKTVPELT